MASHESYNHNVDVLSVNTTTLQAVLATKLNHPRLPAVLVARERLLGALDAALDYRLTLLSAAAGWGKTTLLSAWASRAAVTVAWLSLDALDDKPTRFWMTVIAAVRRSIPSVGTGALAMLHASAPAPLSAVLTVLLNELAALAESPVITIILDDYHLITDPAIHDSMTFFIEHMPVYVHVLLATRVDPDLPLARWRARGALLELRAADLGFSQAETTHFFIRALDAAPTDDEVRLLQRRTEGWAAGVQLAALALRQHADRAAFVQTFAGSHRYVLDYVQEEILAHQPPAVQRFLLRIAVLNRMNAALCAAVSEEPGSQAMLEWLERQNLFVVPLDDARQWYRMHDLLREVLLARLQTTEPALVPVLHQRAAHWYAVQGALREAIGHAFAAEAFANAADLIAQAAPQLWLHGEAQTVHAWMAALPDAVLQQHARLALDAALHLIESVQSVVLESYRTAQADVEHTIARVTPVIDARPAAEAAVLRRRIGLLHAVVALHAALTRGDTERMRLLAEESAALAVGEDGNWKLAALWITCLYTESLQRDGALLIPQLLVAKQQVIETGNQLETIRVMRWLAFAYVRAGRLRAAEAESRTALELVERIDQHAAATGYFYLFLAWVSYAANRLDEAAHAVQRVLQIAHTWQQADQLIIGNRDFMRIALAQGDHVGAEQALRAAEALLEQERVVIHTSAVRAARVEYWLATGNRAAARAWAEQVGFTPETWNPNRKGEFLLLMRVYLAQGQHTRVLAALHRFSAYLDRSGDGDTTIGFLTLHVVALHGAGQRAQAHAVLARLLELTVEEGHIRVFLDAGEPMRQVLTRMRDQADSLPPVSIAYVTTVLAAFAREAQPAVLHAPHDHLPLHHTAPEHADVLIEPLTRREREVLRLLVAGASNGEIAADLVISVATVKKHVSNVLGKLQVATRAQAIARARQWPDLL